jgi:hypothetical protein
MWVRVPLVEEVLSLVERDLSDVRLFDGNGALVPFVVQHQRPGTPAEQTSLSQRSAVRRELPGQAGTPNIYEEVATFALPEGQRRLASLVLTTQNENFVRQVKTELLSSSGDVVSRTDSTVFRFPDGAERLDVPLREVSPQAKQLRLTLQGQGDGYLTPRVLANFAEVAPTPTTLMWPVTGQPIVREGSTLWKVSKPPGVVPMRLSASTTARWFNRVVKVKSPSFVLGEGRIFRIPGSPPVESLEIPLRRASHEQLEVWIENVDSPPLSDLRLAFVVEQPELVFAMPETLPLTLHFGGHRTRPARFDTTSVDDALRRSVEVRSCAVDGATAKGAVAPKTQWAEFRKPGAPVDAGHFAHQAWIRNVDGAEVSSILFGAEHAATMSPQFSDVRLVDSEGRQWPYLLREGEGTLAVPLQLFSTEPGQTGWRFTLQGKVQTLTVGVPAETPFFSRSATLFVTPEGQKRRAQWNGWLTYNPLDRGEPTMLTIPVSNVAPSSGLYELVLADGGDAPVRGLTLEATLNVPTLTAVLPAGDYRALWGGQALEAPQYDVQRVRDVLEALKTAERVAGPPEPNPSYVRPSLVARTGGATRWLFWGALTLVVLVLSVMVLRIARESSSDSS